MKRIDFSYDVFGHVVLTGKELWLIKQCSDSHYDHACQTCFADQPSGPYKNFGKVWIQADLLWQEYRRRKAAGEDIEWDERLRLEDCLEAQVQLKVSSDQLDFCMKILEYTNRYVLKEQADRDACGVLSDDIRRVFHEIQEEWHLKNYGVGLQETDDFRWHVVKEAKVERWYEVETPQLRGMAEAYLPEKADELLVALRRRRNGEDVAREDR